MSIESVRADQIVTRGRLSRALRALGVVSGDTLCVHSSLSRLGLVIGGPRAVVEGIIDAVSPDGTIMMPAYSGDLSDPAKWQHPAVPPDQLKEIRSDIPAYDSALTPTRGMGQVAEYFRSYPSVRRSPHPQSSFTALGRHAELLTGSHPLDDRFGPDSPLGTLCRVGGKVLLLGAPFDTVSLFHLTQHLVGGGARIRKAAPIVQEGQCCWVSYSDIEYPIGWFVQGVEYLIDTGIANVGSVCAANSVLFDAKIAVEALVAWRREKGYVPARAAIL